MIFTVGHGARSAEALVALLKDAGIVTLIDVRAYPASRRHPQFSRASLEKSMRPSYLEYMRTDEFQSAAQALSVRQERVCLMYAESDPASCHRSFIADRLTIRGQRVVHLIEPGLQREHPVRLL